jgi:TetR/AcrR family transcriptional regulator, transcriptional repressor for nem operon
MARTRFVDSHGSSRTKLLDAALKVIRAKGYAATRIEDICDAAGLTKGGFFQHSKSKVDFAIAAAECWSAVTGGPFGKAPYHDHADPGSAPRLCRFPQGAALW